MARMDDPVKIWLASLAARLVALWCLEYLALIGSYAAWVALVAVLAMEYCVLTSPALRGDQESRLWFRGRRRRR